ncbi:MAG: hypothetical protein PHV60_02585 [bacterium]|nr:hypothetical protein [bacterium]
MKITLTFIFFMGWIALSEAAYLEPERKNREYELDLLTQRFPRSWEKLWQASDNAIRVSGGSVNVRDLLFTNQVKFKAPLTARLNLKGDINFYQTINGTAITRNGFDRIDTFDQSACKNIFEFEYLLTDSLSGSLLGVPAFEKQRTDLGLGLTWSRKKLTYVKINYWWLNFDNNYAYSKEKEFDDREERYNKNPREIQISASYDNKGIYTYLELVLTPTAIKEYSFYSSPDNWYRQETRSDYYKQGLEYKVNLWLILGLELFRETGKQGQEFIVSRQVDNYHNYYSKYYISPYLEYTVGQTSLVSLELRYQRKYFVQDFPQAQGYNFHYHKKEMLPVLSYQCQFGKFWEMELAYLREAAEVSRVYPATPELNNYKDTLVDDRFKIGFSYKISARLELKGMTGIELDHRDQGRFPYLDKGAVQFMTTF